MSNVAVIETVSLFGSSRGSLSSSNTCRTKTKAKQLPTKKASISLNELQRIKKSVSTPLQKRQQSNDDESCHNSKLKPTQTEAAKARKEYMKQLELKGMEEQKKMGFQCDNVKLGRIHKTGAREDG